MDGFIYDTLKDYRIISEKLYEAVQFENYEELEELLVKRQNIIDNLNTLNYQKEDFVQASNELDILKMDESIYKLMSIRKEDIKKQIIHLKKGTLVNIGYNQTNYKESILLNKKY